MPRAWASTFATDVKMSRSGSTLDVVSRYPRVSTDSRHSPAVSVVGVDTVVVTGPTTPALREAMAHRRDDFNIDLSTGETTLSSSGSMTWPVGDAHPRISTRMGTDTPRMRVQVSLPRMLYGHNAELLPVGFLADGVDALLTELGRGLPSVPSIDQVQLQRLDLGRDFLGVMDTSKALIALGSRPMPRSRLNVSYDRRDGRKQTVYTGSRSSYCLRAYDKAHELQEAIRHTADRGRTALLETLAAAAIGALRFELQLQRRALRRQGLAVMRDADPQVLEDVARGYFVQAGWGEAYGGPSRLAETLTKLQATLSRADFKNLVTFMACTDLGVEHGLSPKIVDRIKPFARACAMHSPDDLELRHLDFSSGSERPAAPR